MLSNCILRNCVLRNCVLRNCVLRLLGLLRLTMKLHSFSLLRRNMLFNSLTQTNSEPASQFCEAMFAVSVTLEQTATNNEPSFASRECECAICEFRFAICPNYAISRSFSEIWFANLRTCFARRRFGTQCSSGTPILFIPLGKRA
ncbi:hypothetical protein [Paenibacillus sp. NEAU-GSW1]|uniref:hypothetical protein n=1 Tax=Paenibacillus sp. NEAU-GSW1 TaxID=2682486 RepID=UPI003463DCB0